MTANDFFRACELGYKACGYETGDLSPSELYLRYADGRDEGLTGTGYGLNEGPGIDFDDPEAWEHWYFNRNRSGGHPWEVVRGGNSTHVDLFVCHDRYTLDWKVTIGELTQEEADRLPRGYFFHIAGKHRPMESVRFYLAIHDAGLPVIISTAEEILARYEGTDYIGIVPHSETPKYCESMFPAKYGRVIDFTHVYEDEDEWFGQIIPRITYSSAVKAARYGRLYACVGILDYTVQIKNNASIFHAFSSRMPLLRNQAGVQLQAWQKLLTTGEP